MYNSMLHIGTEGTFIHAASVLGSIASMDVAEDFICILLKVNISSIRIVVANFFLVENSYDRAFYRKCGNGEHLCMAENKPKQ